MKQLPISILLSIGLWGGIAHAQDDPISALKSFDGQQRQAVETLRKEAQQSLSDPAKRGRIETGLVSVLSDPNATLGGKQEATRLLWMLGADRSVTVLTKMLGDEATADIARYGLERSPSPAVAKQLLAALRTAKGKTAVGIINTLGNRGDAEAAAGLKPYIASTDRLIADAAIVALGKIGTPPAIAILLTAKGNSLLVGQSLLRAGDHLAAAGKTAAAAELYAFQTRPGTAPAVHAGALRRLAAVAPTQALAAAKVAVTSPDERVSAVAGNVLSLVADTETVRKNLPAWQKLPAVAQTPLLAGLTARKMTAALPLAQSALTQPEEILGVTSVNALAVLGGANSVPTLAQTAASGKGEVKSAARTALIQLPGAAAEAAILKEAKSGEMKSRLALLGILAERGTKEDLALLMESAAGSEEPIAVEALKSIERSGIAADSAVLIRVLTTTQSDAIREAAQSTLVANTRRSPGTEDAIIGALGSAPSPARATLISALAQIGGDKGLAELSKAVSSSDAAVKEAAITGLADTWSDSRPLPLLLATARADSSKSYRVQALRGYFRLLGQDEKMPPGDRVAKVKDGLAAAERPEEKQQALAVLRDCRIPAAVELANTALDDAALFDTAADTVLYLAAEQKKGDATLAAVKGPATTAALNKILQKSKDDGVKAQAQKLL